MNATDRLVAAHACAMAAKGMVFAAQDRCSEFFAALPDGHGIATGERFARKLARHLARVRDELETLDREFRSCAEVQP